MEREKMIEEIEKVLQLEQIKIANTTEEFAKLQKDGINRCNAEALYNANCRIVHDGAVVLTPEERDEEMKEYNRDRAEREKQVRKETETEILKKLNGFRFVMYDEGYEVASWTCGEDEVKQFAKEIGAEVEE